MGYKLRFERKAKAELEASCSVYLAEFSKEIRQWLSTLASEASEGKYLISQDFTQILEDVLDDEHFDPQSWVGSWRRFLQASAKEKVKALYVAVTRFKPPWQTRVAEQQFSVLGIFSTDVKVIYQLDHVNKHMIVRMFFGLPGQ